MYVSTVQQVLLSIWRPWNCDICLDYFNIALHGFILLALNRFNWQFFNQHWVLAVIVLFCRISLNATLLL